MAGTENTVRYTIQGYSICSDPLELQSNSYALNKGNALAEGSSIQHRIVLKRNGGRTLR